MHRWEPPARAPLDLDASARTSWEHGASVERIVGAWLDQIPGIEVLHDRRVPGSRMPIDHLAVAPAGVFVVDAKRAGRRLAPSEVRGLVRGDDRPLITGGDHEKVVARLAGRVRAVARVLADAPVPVAAALCLVDGHDAAARRSFLLDGVWVGTPGALPELVGHAGLLDHEAIRTVAARLDARLATG